MHWPKACRFLPISRKIKGFTLIELMVTLIILAIGACLAAPSFVQLTSEKRALTVADDLRTALQLARSEAVMRRRSVLMCRSNSGGDACQKGTDWSGGWMILQSGGGVIKVWQGKARMRIFGPEDGITFLSSGGVEAGASFLVSPVACSGQQRRNISVFLSGASKLERGGCL